MTSSSLVAILLGVLAAAVFTTSFALQQRANLIALRAHHSGASAVVRRPEWVGGIALQPVAFAFQAVALGTGAFAVVQPALITQLVFMVPAGAWVVDRRPAGRDLVAPLVVLVGLAAFELAARPSGGRDIAPFGDWVVPLLGVVVVLGGCFAAGEVVPAYRAALRGTAAGVWGAMIGAFANQVIALGADGPAAFLGSWATWALVTAGIINFLWVNLALRAGRLSSSLSAMSAAAAAASVLLAVTVFAEQLAGGAVARTLAALGSVVCGLGIALVARSPSLLALDAGTDPEGSDAAHTNIQGGDDAGWR